MFVFSGFYLKLENQLFEVLMAYNLEEKIEVRIVSLSRFFNHFFILYKENYSTLRK